MKTQRKNARQDSTIKGVAHSREETTAPQSPQKETEVLYHTSNAEPESENRKIEFAWLIFDFVSECSRERVEDAFAEIRSVYSGREDTRSMLNLIDGIVELVDTYGKEEGMRKLEFIVSEVFSKQ